jgi:hypothetical protein
LVNEEKIYEKQMSEDFEWKSSVPVMVGGDWTAEAEFFSGKVYFGEITTEIVSITKIREIIQRERAKFT